MKYQQKETTSSLQKCLDFSALLLVSLEKEYQLYPTQPLHTNFNYNTQKTWHEKKKLNVNEKGTDPWEEIGCCELWIFIPRKSTNEDIIRELDK